MLALSLKAIVFGRLNISSHHLKAYDDAPQKKKGAELPLSFLIARRAIALEDKFTPSADALNGKSTKI